MASRQFQSKSPFITKFKKKGYSKTHMEAQKRLGAKAILRKMNDAKGLAARHQLASQSIVVISSWYWSEIIHVH